MDPASSEPDPPRLPRLDSGSFNLSSNSASAKKLENCAEQEKIKAWASKAAVARASDLDPGAIARAEAHLVDPNYPNDEVLDAVARNLILREGF